MGPVGFWGEAGYRDVLSHDGDPVSVSLAGNTARAMHIEAGDPETIFSNPTKERTRSFLQAVLTKQ